MKSSNTIVSVIVIAAVLLAAYAVGLLIRQARMGNTQPPVATDAKEALRQQHQAAVAPHAPGVGQTAPAPADAAALKQERALALEKRDSLSEAEKQQLREQVRERFSSRRRGKGEFRERMLQQREALKAPKQARLQGGQNQPPVNRPSETPQSEHNDTEQNTNEAGAEPNQAGRD